MLRLNLFVSLFASLVPIALCAGVAWADAPAYNLPLAAGPAQSRTLGAKSLDSERCWASAVQVGKEGVVLAGTSGEPLAPGCYRLHVPLAISPLGDVRMAALKIRILTSPNATVIGKPQLIDVLNFAKADEFTDSVLDFGWGGGSLPFSVRWWLAGNAKLEVAAQTDAAPNPDKDDTTLDGLASQPALAADGSMPRHDLAGLGYHVASAAPWLERLCPVAISSVHTDKIVYQPGDAAGCMVELANESNQPASLHLQTSIISGLNSERAVSDQQITLAANQKSTLQIPFTLANLYWGAEFHVSVQTADGLQATAGDTFAVSRDMWETAFMRGLNYTTVYAGGDKAAAAIDEWRSQGYTGFESGFWAPDDFGGLVPDHDVYYSGHLDFRESSSATRALLANAHRQGIRGALYAILSMGSGPVGFELFRKHPDWFSGGDYDTSWFEMWRAAEAGQVDMKAVWSLTYVENKMGDAPMQWHASQIVDTHRKVGWDAVRYDVYDTNPLVNSVTAKVRKWVESECPEFQWGYNCFIPKSEKDNALDIMVGNGGLAMEEAVRNVTKGSSSVARYADTLLGYRDTVWPHNGHLGVCYDAGENTVPLDSIYLSSIMLAVGGHPFYDRLENRHGNFPEFGLRYSEYFFNNKMRPLQNAQAAIELAGDPPLLYWSRFARKLDLGDNRHRLILHLINMPPDYVTIKNLALKAPPPIRNLGISVKLPPGARVTGAFDLCPISATPQTELPVQNTAGAITLTVPEVRFWNVVVIDYSGPEGLQ